MRGAVHDGLIVKISLGMLVTIGSGLVATVFWLAMLSFNSSAHSTELADVKSDQKAYLSTVQNIDKRLSGIEGRLNIPAGIH